MKDDVSLEELLIARMAHEFRDGHMGVGATILSDLAARLAKTLYCPGLFLTTASRAAADCDVHAKTLSDEWMLAASARMALDWEQMFRLVAQQRLEIWMGAVQIDREGCSNISVIGDWERPRVQLVGARGIPDDLWGCRRLNYHVKKHSRHSFVEKVDFVCGFGPSRGRSAQSRQAALPGVVVSDLGVFELDENRGVLGITSLHPGVSFDTVQKKTGFDWGETRTVFPETPLPTREELEVIRDIIDPLGLRRLEGAGADKELLLELWQRDREMLDEQAPAGP